MRYTDIPCVCCRQTFTEKDDAVVCPQCGSPHHSDCWKEQGGCFNRELHAQGYVWDKEEKNDRNEKIEVVWHPNETRHVPVNCPYCGARNYGNELYCVSCREPIHPNASAAPGEPMRDAEQRKKVYEDFSDYGGLDPQSYIGDVSVRELSAYFTKNAGQYIRRYSVMRNSNARVSWNWGAFALSAVSLVSSLFLTPVWFFYRKRVKPGLLLAGVLLLSILVSSFALAGDPAYYTYSQGIRVLEEESIKTFYGIFPNRSELSQETIEATAQTLTETFTREQKKSARLYLFLSSCVLTIILPVGVGMFANIFYFKRAGDDILSLRQSHGKDPKYYKILSQRGGVSVVGAALGAVYAVALFVLGHYLPQWLAVLFYG